MTHSGQGSLLVEDDSRPVLQCVLGSFQGHAGLRQVVAGYGVLKMFLQGSHRPSLAAGAKSALIIEITTYTPGSLELCLTHPQPRCQGHSQRLDDKPCPTDHRSL